MATENDREKPKPELSQSTPAERDDSGNPIFHFTDVSFTAVVDTSGGLPKDVPGFVYGWHINVRINGFASYRYTENHCPVWVGGLVENGQDVAMLELQSIDLQSYEMRMFPVHRDGVSGRYSSMTIADVTGNGCGYDQVVKLAHDYPEPIYTAVLTQLAGMPWKVLADR